MKTVTSILILSALLAIAQRFVNPEMPKPIKVIAPTEQTLREEMRREQLEREYKRAAATAKAIYRRSGCRSTFAVETGRAAVDYGISPRVLAALVFVESSCNPNAVSGRASVGLCQVNPLVWHYTQAELKNPNRNLRIGASILASYVHRFGLKEGLHHFNGMGNPTDEYSSKVLIAAGIQVS